MTAANSEFMWIETGGTSSVRRYQIDLKNEIAEFFDEKTDGKSEVNIKFQGNEYSGQQLRKKDEEHHFTPQWRLYLPTEFNAYDDDYYPDSVVRFQRIEQNGTRWYQMEITESESDTHDQWKSEAQREGTQNSTDAVIPSESREFGYY